MFAAKKKTIILSFRQDSSVLTAACTAGTATVCRVIPEVVPLKLFLDNYWFRKSQEGLEITDQMTQSLLTWTAQEGKGIYNAKNMYQIVHAF